jgi:type IV secretion system protein VirD4
VAPTGSGKGRDVLVPALLTYQGSCIVIDPKGQLAAITRRRREEGMGQKVYVLNPFNILPDYLGKTSLFNPLAALDPTLDSFGTDCDNIADAIVVHEAGGHDTHWTESAHGLISSLIGHLAANMSRESRNLAKLREIIRKPGMLEDQAKAAQPHNGGKDALVAEALEGFMDLKEAPNKSELASIVSTARTQTKFLGTKAISDNVSGNGFSFRELKKKPTTVYLTLPTRYLATCSKWFRLVVAAALDDLLREDEPGVPVLLILDEFYQLGRLKAIQNAMSLARGYGVQLWPILQDLTQLQEHYEKSWETFLGNAGVQQFFAPRENTTAEYLSKLCGQTTVMVGSWSKGASSGKSSNTGRGLFDGTTGKSDGENSGTSYSPRERQAKLPQEIRQLRGTEFLYFDERRPGRYEIYYREAYLTIPEFQGPPPLYSPDPYHKPKPAPPVPVVTPMPAPQKRKGWLRRTKLRLSQLWQDSWGS